MKLFHSFYLKNFHEVALEFEGEDMRMISGVRTSIKEGMLKAEEAFALPETRAEKINNLIADDGYDLDTGEVR